MTKNMIDEERTDLTVAEYEIAEMRRQLGEAEIALEDARFNYRTTKESRDRLVQRERKLREALTELGTRTDRSGDMADRAVHLFVNAALAQAGESEPDPKPQDTEGSAKGSEEKPSMKTTVHLLHCGQVVCGGKVRLERIEP